MKILAIECSAAPASCAVVENGKILYESFVSVGLTHSQTLMPMVENMLKCSGLSLSDMDALAISAGPGSFTGLRIGIAALKGMAFGLSKPCVGISTLETIAYGLMGQKGIICAAMDARCSQVYNALFYSDGQSLSRICDDRAIMLSQLSDELSALRNDNSHKNEPVILAGDGANLCYNTFGREFPDISLAPEHIRYQRASSVGLLAEPIALNGGAVSADRIMPVYLRLPQAERELRAKNGK